MNLSELGENTDSEYDKEHRCKANQFPTLDRLVHCVTRHDEAHPAWELHGIHYADEHEVNMGEAQYLGEITYHSVIEVHFCPFCGEKLNAE